MCIANCQAKTYASFDMFMKFEELHAQNKTWRSYIDISKYTGMEVEHKHDTGNELKARNDMHFSGPNNKDHMKSIRKELGGLQRQAHM